MAKIGVIHLSLNSLGGAEKLCIETIHALKKAGHNVDLIACFRTNKRRIKEVFGVDVPFDKEIVVFPNMPLGTIYSRFVRWFFRDIIYVPRLKKNYDLMISTYPLLPMTFADVVYFNGFEVPGSLEIYYKKYQSAIMKIYKFPYEFLIGICVSVFNSLQYKPVMLANSQFTKDVITRYLDLAPIVVYPPVDVEKYMTLSRNKKRKNIVLTISRIEEVKRLEIVPRLALKVLDAEFVVIGALSSVRYLNYLKKFSKSLGVSDRVKFFTNVSEDIKKDFLSKSKIFLHPSEYEPFGIAIVEAMAAGLVPLVHRSGGPWIDILGAKQGLYGYSFEDIDSCAASLNQLLKNDGLRREIAENAVKRSKVFACENFRRNINFVVQKLSAELTCSN